MPGISRRAAINATGAAVLLPYVKPHLTVLGAPAAQQLSGTPVATITWTPVPQVTATSTPTPTPPPGELHYRIHLRVDGLSAEASTKVPSLLLRALQDAITTLNGRSQISGGSSGPAGEIWIPAANQPLLDSTIRAAVAAIRFDADGATDLTVYARLELTLLP